jgi:hypothetical protein
MNLEKATLSGCVPAARLVTCEWQLTRMRHLVPLEGATGGGRIPAAWLITSEGPLPCVRSLVDPESGAL